MISLRFLEEIEDFRKIHISYESLLDRPDEIVTAICSKLELEYDNKMLSYYTSEESHHTADSGRMWESVIKPIIKDNKGKFYNELTEEEINIFETVAGSSLEKLGYKRSFPLKTNITLDVEKYDKLNTHMIAERRQNTTAKELQNRAKQEQLLDEIKRKFEILE